MWSDKTIKRIQARVESMLNETCTIEREVLSTDEYGARVHTWASVASGVACRVIRAGTSNQGAGQVIAEQETMIDRYRLIVPAGTVLDVDYRVTVGARVYGVVNIADDLSDETHVSAIVTLLR